VYSCGEGWIRRIWEVKRESEWSLGEGKERAFLFKRKRDWSDRPLRHGRNGTQGRVLVERWS